MLTQIVIDLFKNKLIKVYTEPGGGVTITHGGPPMVSRGVVKFYPTGAKETVTYETSELVNESIGGGDNKTFV
jgi:hypothetical protein